MRLSLLKAHTGDRDQDCCEAFDFVHVGFMESKTLAKALDFLLFGWALIHNILIVSNLCRQNNFEIFAPAKGHRN